MPQQGTSTAERADMALQASRASIWRELEELGANLPALAPFAPTITNVLELVGGLIAVFLIARAAWRLLRRKPEPRS